jgi:cobalt-zinc-cadmium efflux system protein
MWIAGRPATDGRTFGYYRAEILAAIANAVLLVGVAAFIIVSAIGRLDDPPEVQGGLMLALGVVGLIANGAAAMLLRRSQAGSLNVRGAYFEVVGDLFGSAAVIVAAVVIALTGWQQADAVASIVVALLIVPRTVGLLREAIDVLLEATPRGMRLEEVRAHIIGADGVADVHDLHAWTITSGLPVISAHVVLKPDAEPARVLDELCACLAGDFDVEHSTFQLETVDRRRLESAAHV